MTRHLEILQQSVDETIAALGVARPIEGATASELEIWLVWWRPALETVRKLTTDRIAYLRAGGWWPPIAAEQVYLGATLDRVALTPAKTPFGPPRSRHSPHPRRNSRSS